MRDLLAKFVTAIEAEIALIEKESRDQTYELLSGQRDEKSTGKLYVFLLADPLRLPEEAYGTLQADGKELSAMVVAQEGNRIWLLLDATEPLPVYLGSGRLVLNQTDLLRRLKEQIQLLQAHPDLGLAPSVFGYVSSTVSSAELPPHISERLDDSPAKAALQQALGSDVTFLWGPPGTGKTFTIAALVASLAELNETVVVTSHTHAAVEQALWELIKPADGRQAGFLHRSPLLDEGRILKIGPLRSKDNFPPTVQLENYLEEKAEEREASVLALQEEHERTIAQCEDLQRQIGIWQRYHEIRADYEEVLRRYDETRAGYTRTLGNVELAQRKLTACKVLEGSAEKSFFIGRRGRVEKARRELLGAQNELKAAQADAGIRHARVILLKGTADEQYEHALQAQRATKRLTPLAGLEVELHELTNRAGLVASEIDALKASVDEDAKTLVKEAAAVFATLTKLYMDRNILPGLTWDTAVIDEASMAMLPLVAYAAARARKRVVIVGDMFQLPPIVQSPPDGEGAILGKDIFEHRGITDALDQRKEFRELAKLLIQWRMNPEIAGVARKLISSYRELEDHPKTRDQKHLSFTRALGTESPLVVVDTSDLRPWSGKMPGSLSRFNFLSGQVAAELAALYARGLQQPSEETPPSIGIVTPFAAQRRYLGRLVQTLGLERWVSAGTVHTFQGNECDVIVFDSVLGDPHWGARLTDPKQFKQVRKDLNVAVTRARHQFVFVADSKWLTKHAGSSSGYGVLWSYLKDRAVILRASDLLGDGLRSRLAQSLSEVNGWTLKQERSELLTEADFYPAFAADLGQANTRVVLYTPFIGKTRWPLVEPHIAALRERGVEVYVLHKPLSDPEWRKGDRDFGQHVFDGLTAIGVKLIRMSGVHAKTIVIDSRIVYEGSLNWASQTSSYEHMWRFESKDMALLVEKMLQLEPITQAYDQQKVGDRCPNCRGKLMVINQAQQTSRVDRAQQKRSDPYPVKLGCYNHAEDKTSCEGYLRRVDGRPPFLRPPTCGRGTRMQVHYTQSGRPWDWRCGDKGCRPIRWARGDCLD